jgi:hypothetical protein
MVNNFERMNNPKGRKECPTVTLAGNKGGNG